MPFYRLVVDGTAIRSDRKTSGDGAAETPRTVLLGGSQSCPACQSSFVQFALPLAVTLAATRLPFFPSVSSYRPPSIQSGSHETMRFQ